MSTLVLQVHLIHMVLEQDIMEAETRVQIPVEYQVPAEEHRISVLHPATGQQDLQVE